LFLIAKQLEFERLQFYKVSLEKLRELEQYFPVWRSLENWSSIFYFPKTTVTGDVNYVRLVEHFRSNERL